MNKIEKLSLIDGNFSDDEAKEILMSIFSAKMQFHGLKDFSSQERFGKKDELAQKRILELKREIEKVLQIVSEARLKQKRLIISSEINISYSDE